MRKPIAAFAALILSLSLISGCGRPETKLAVSVRHYNAGDLDPRIAEASNAFGLRLYSALSEADEGSNLWLSPLSVSTALALTYGGASGSTADAMAGTLGLSALQRDEVGPGYRVLLDLLNHPADEKIKLAAANSLWLRQGYKFIDEFTENSSRDYGAEVRAIDFDEQASALKQMNGWVKERTNGKIPKIIDEIGPDARLIILNAVAFQGAWKLPFIRTDDAKFFVSPDQSVTVPMMLRGGEFEYADERDYEAIRIPIGDKGQYAFVILLPKPNASLQALREQVAAEPELLTRHLDERSGSITLPKFRIDYSAELSDALKSLGMGEAFDAGGASFAGILPEPPNLFISGVQHKTYLSVDEEGIEAAAVTMVGMDAGGASPADPFDMTVNRPFIAAIEDGETNALLFVGTIFDPE